MIDLLSDDERCQETNFVPFEFKINSTFFQAKSMKYYTFIYLAKFLIGIFFVI